MKYLLILLLSSCATPPDSYFKNRQSTDCVVKANQAQWKYKQVQTITCNKGGIE